MRYLIIALALAATTAAALCQDAEPAEPEGQVLVARAEWPDQDLSNTSFRVFADQAMHDLVDVFPATSPDGSALLALRPGRYWLQAIVDLNGNNRPDAGDGLGWYGVEELSREARPQPLQVRDGMLKAVVIPILVHISEDGGLRSLPWAEARRPATVSGNVEGMEGDVIVAMLDVDDPGRSAVKRPDTAGSFSFKVLPGAWRVLAAADLTGDGMLGVGDLIATRGFEGDPLNVEPGAETDLGTLSLAQAEQAPSDLPAIVGGRVTGAQTREGAVTQIAFCTDVSMRGVVFSTATDADGRFLAIARPATYFLRATCDLGADGMLGPGDMVGFYGVSDLLADKPQPLALAPGSLRTDANIAITGRMDESGKLTTYSADTDADTIAPETETGD